MTDSQIQQAGKHSTQTGSFDRGSKGRAAMEKLVETLNEHIGEMNLDESARKKAEAQVATIDAQLEDDDPNPVIIAQAGKTLRNITEGAIASLIATAVQPSTWHWVAHVMSTYFPK